MPTQPSPAQSAASRANGTRSAGPRDTGRSRFNARRHGFAAAFTPPTDPDERRFYNRLLADLNGEFRPCSRAEWMALEEIAALELRRAKIQQTLMDAPISLEEAQVRGTLLLSRYEGDTARRVGRQWARLEALQAGRAHRRRRRWEAEKVLQDLRAEAGGSGSFGENDDELPPGLEEDVAGLLSALKERLWRLEEGSDAPENAESA